MTLNSTQINDLLTRNGTLSQTVSEYNGLNLIGEYNQSSSDYVNTDGSLMTFLQFLTSVSSPIPPYGLEINDPTYGYVDIFPAADGTLVYTTQPVSNPSAQSVMAGGSSIIPNFPTLPQVTGSIELLMLLAIGVVGYLILRETK